MLKLSRWHIEDVHTTIAACVECVAGRIPRQGLHVGSKRVKNIGRFANLADEQILAAGKRKTARVKQTRSPRKRSDRVDGRVDCGVGLGWVLHFCSVSRN